MYLHLILIYLNNSIFNNKHVNIILKKSDIKLGDYAIRLKVRLRHNKC